MIWLSDPTIVDTMFFCVVFCTPPRTAASFMNLAPWRSVLALLWSFSLTMYAFVLYWSPNTCS